MRLPRRVPWSSLAELDQVCSWIFTDENNLDAKVLAVNRLSAWRAITPLPHALDATLSLLSSILLDQPPQCHNVATSSSSAMVGFSSSLNLRQSYATAIVRFVNGLVDPLQLGTYARSIASIAAQIGLPQWLVELRHAVTHEELPSLEQLRSGARESLNWLLHNYFLPTLTPSVEEQEGQAPIVLSPLSPLLKQYKNLLKVTTRDASLKTQYKSDITKILRDVDRWVGEAKVAASAGLFSGYGAESAQSGDEEDEREGWALERLSENLLDRGGLVPVSSKKRLASKLNEPPALPPLLKAIWSPLLQFLQARHQLFASTLVLTAVGELLAEKEESQKRDISYDLCLAAWINWCTVELGSSNPNTDVGVNKELIVGNLVIALGPSRKDSRSKERKGATALLDLLTQGDEQLLQRAHSLLSLSQLSQRTESIWQDNDTQMMEERLNALLAASRTTSEQLQTEDIVMEESVRADEEYHEVLPEGWSFVSISSWHSCPIGVYVQ